MKKYRGNTQQPVNKSRKFVTVSLPLDITEVLERIAKVENITRSYLITNILDEYVKKYDMKLLEQREYVKDNTMDFNK